MGALAPPAVDFAGGGDPDILVLAELDEVVQQRFEDARWRVHDVVRMNDEAHQSVLVKDGAGLPLPDVDGVVVQDVEEGVILDGRDRDLEDVADEIGHDGAAAAVLGIEMGDVGHGHVEGAVEGVVPDLFAVKDSAEAFGAVLAAIGIDFFGAFEELLAVLVEMAVVVEVVDDDFEAASRSDSRNSGVTL